MQPASVRMVTHLPTESQRYRGNGLLRTYNFLRSYSYLILLWYLIFEDISTFIKVPEVKKLAEFAEVKKFAESAELVNFTTEFINFINKLNKTIDLKTIKVLFMIIPFILNKISKCFLKSYQY